MREYKIRKDKIEEFLALSAVQRSHTSGIPQETWSRWKKGTLEPGTRRIRVIAPKFGLTYVEAVIAFEELRQNAEEALLSA